MGKRRWRSAVALASAVLLVVPLAGGATIASAQMTFTEQRITSANAEQQDIEPWGDTIVWADQRNHSGAFWDVYAYDLSTGTEIHIAVKANDQGQPDVFGDVVVWADERHGNGDIYMYDLSDDEETRITDEAEDQGYPAIYGTTIVWVDGRDTAGASGEIYMYDIMTGQETRLTNDNHHQELPDIHGKRIVWGDWRNDPNPVDGTFLRDVYMHDLVTGAETRITDEAADQAVPRIWGDTVTWEDERHDPGNTDDVYTYDIPSMAEMRVVDDPSDQDDPDVFRDLVAWEDLRGGTNDIRMFKLPRGPEEQVTNDTTNYQEDPKLWGNKVFWEDDGDTANDVYMASFQLTLDRSGGATRYGTSELVSANHFATADTVVIATGAEFADALSASGLAGCYGGPLLLTLPDMLSPEAAREIDRLAATDAVIVGGEGAVTPDVAGALSDMGLTVDRIGGSDRYDTAALIAAEIESITGATFEQTAFVARGDAFPDALAVSPVAYANRFPILLTRPAALPPVTDAAIRDLDIETAVVAGGPGAVSADVKNAVDALLDTNGGTLSMRWAGPTRYETAVEVAEQATEMDWAGRGFVGVAVGDNFPDALSGGAAAGREFGVLLLTRTDDLPTAAEDFVADSGDGIGWVEAFGGQAVVTDGAGDEAVQLLP